MLKESDVLAVAQLARLELNPSEVKKYTGQLEKVLELFEKLKALKLDDVDETSQVGGLTNVCQDDTVTEDERSRPSGHRALFENVPRKDDGSIVVPKIIER